MINNLTPQYRPSLIPATVSETSSYNLKNANDVRTINARTNQYFNSFLPFPIRDWNSLLEELKNSVSVSSFKFYLNQVNDRVPKYYYFGDRRSQILHTRLRTKHSLNCDICLKNLTDSPYVDVVI